MLSSGKIFFGTDWYSRTSMPNESSWSSIRVTLSKYCFIPLKIVKILKFQAEIAKNRKNCEIRENFEKWLRVKCEKNANGDLVAMSEAYC